MTIEAGKKQAKQVKQAKNVLGGELQTCCVRPMTGFFRRGSCETGPHDYGNHVVCAIMTNDFLEFTYLKEMILSALQKTWSLQNLSLAIDGAYTLYAGRKHGGLE